MSQNVILKINPKIEFQLFESGFKLVDEQTKQNSGFYSYNDLQFIELNNVWFPKFAKYLRSITWILNGGVPYFPNAETYKNASLIFNFKKTKLGIWLTDVYMAKSAKKLEKLIEKKLYST